MQRRRSKDRKKADGMEGQVRTDGQTDNRKMKYIEQKTGQKRIGMAAKSASYNRRGGKMATRLASYSMI